MLSILPVFETSLPESLPVLAAHVYYRALQSVPSVIRSYWTSLQNLTLSRAVQSFTSRHFSPLLVSDELAALRDPSSPVGQQLRDNDDFTVKVAQNASEVKVVFVVDEEQLEIGIKVPSEFPLAGVEVSERRRVGVSDKQFRAWLLGMNQTITAQVRPASRFAVLCRAVTDQSTRTVCCHCRRYPALQAERAGTLRRRRELRHLLFDRLARPRAADQVVQDMRQQVPRIVLV